MAFVEHIIETDKNLDEILHAKRITGARYIKVHKTAAVTIQRYYRGYYTRLYFSKLHLAAVIIQKYWKGYITRRYNGNNYNNYKYSFEQYILCFRNFDELVIETFVNKSIKYYNESATVIQSHFKGYYTRKHYADVKKMKKWVKNNQDANDEWSKVMRSYKQNICVEFEKVYKEKVKSLIIKMAYKFHPLLRTKAIQGVYSDKGTKNTYSDSEFEQILRSIYIKNNKK